MQNDDKLEQQRKDLFVEFPKLILKIFLEKRVAYLGGYNNEVRDRIIERIDEVYKDTIAMLKAQDYSDKPPQ